MREILKASSSKEEETEAESPKVIQLVSDGARIQTQVA